MNNIDIEVLVNGSPVAKYHKNGQVYIQANEGSEYEIKISNRNWCRILAVVSVDGLSVMSGKTSSVDDAGYVIGAYNSYKIKGYRYNNDSVGAFKFSKKEQSYASTKGKKSARNCGVIGVCVYGEKQTQINWSPSPNDLWTTYRYPDYKNNDMYTTNINTNWVGGPTNNQDKTFTCGSPTKGIGDTVDTMFPVDSDNCVYSCKLDTSKGIDSIGASVNEPKQSFDLGSTWGKNKESKVVETDFERGEILVTQDIYYASREALIESGVIEESKPKVSFPKSFPKKYATPPPGWNG